MREKKTLYIGMMLEDIHTDFSKELVTSVVNSIPADKDIRLIVLPGKYYDEATSDIDHAYRMMHNSVFHLGEVCRFDGMIIHLGSMSKNISEMLEDFVEKTGDALPKVFIGLDDPELVTVNYDNSSGITETVNYLINVCGMRKFCMLGGREDNKDARIRKDFFAAALAENGIRFENENFINTDMSEDCTDQAEILLDNNPDTQVVFCVNDASAKALYKVMGERKLVPGKDIMVFGFDNTNMSGELIPALSSIGAFGSSLGQRSLELLLAMINGEEVTSQTVDTRLYGRDSLPYEMYDYTVQEMTNVETAFIYRMFDDCFYRYKGAYRDREMIDLRRLFYEFISRMLFAMKRRFMSLETYEELCSLIDIFFENGAVRYTDASKLIKSMKRLQDSMNAEQRSPMASVRVNRLFLHIKDKALYALSKELFEVRNEKIDELCSFRDFTAASMGYCCDTEDTLESIYRSLNVFGIDDAAFYMYEKPYRYSSENLFNEFPPAAELKCVVRDGVTHIVSENRQRCQMADIFEKNELPKKSKGYIVFPVFHLDLIYGLLLCSTEGDICDKGEYIALQLGRAIFLNFVPETDIAAEGESTLSV